MSWALRGNFDEQHASRLTWQIKQTPNKIQRLGSCHFSEPFPLQRATTLLIRTTPRLIWELPVRREAATRNENTCSLGFKPKYKRSNTAEPWMNVSPRGNGCGHFHIKWFWKNGKESQTLALPRASSFSFWYHGPLAFAPCLGACSMAPLWFMILYVYKVLFQDQGSQTNLNIGEGQNPSQRSWYDTRD